MKRTVSFGFFSVRVFSPRWRRLRPSEKRRVLEKRCGREGAGTRGRRARRIGACAASRARARRRERRAPGFLGAWRDTPRGTRGAARARPSRAMCRCREDARAGGRTHRTSCVSRSGSVRSTNPLGCAVITGHGTSVDGSSTIAGAAAARLGAPAPALLTAGMA